MKAILFHGTDALAVQEHVRTYIDSIKYSCQRFGAEDLVSGQIAQEVMQQGFWQDPTIYVIDGLGDAHIKSLSALIENIQVYPLILIAKGYLKASSKLRTYMSKSPDYAVRFCATMALTDLQGFITKEVEKKKLHFSGEAIQCLAEFFIDNPGLISVEIEKLSLYKKDINVEDVKSLCAPVEEFHYGEFAESFLEKDIKNCMRYMRIYKQHGGTAVGAIRIVQKELLRMLEHGICAAGPGFLQKKYKGYSWDEEAVLRALHQCMQIEVWCKKCVGDDMGIIAHLLIEVLKGHSLALYGIYA